MTTLIDNTQTLIETALRWMVVNDREFLAVTTDAAGTTHMHRVTHTDLHSIDPALPTLLHNMGAWAKQYQYQHQAYIDGNYVRYTLALQNGHTYAFTDHANYEIHFVSLQNLELAAVKALPECLHVSGLGLLTVRDYPAHQPQPFVSRCERITLLVTKNDLDRRYPGWAERWLIGKELGITDTALMHHVFTCLPGAEDKASIPDINFE